MRTDTASETRTPAAPAPGPAPAERIEPTAPGADVLGSPVLCADGLPRCPWALSSPDVLADHDTAWGLRPVAASGWFAALSLEILQAGLAPGAAVSRLPALQEALSGFDPEAVALLDDDGVDELLLDRRLIRNRAKLTALVLAARSARCWTPGDWEEVLGASIPEQGPERVQAVVARLREHGVVHAGPGTVARLLARTGLAPGHLAGCFRA